MPWPGEGGVGGEDGGALSLGRGHGGEGGRGGGDQWGGERGLLAARKVAVSSFGEGGVESRECCGQGWTRGGVEGSGGGVKGESGEEARPLSRCPAATAAAAVVVAERRLRATRGLARVTRQRG